MAPRTQSWSSHKDSPASRNAANSLLVLEDYEVFEAEAAELSVEELDELSSPLLLDVENPAANGNGYGHEMCELTTLVTRNFHPVHSAHSLATTSVVTPAQHAHTAEYKTLATTSSSKLPNDVSRQLFTEMHDSEGTKSTIGPDFRILSSDLSCFPAHLLTAVSRIGQPCCPALWPERMLAYTDAPALANAIGTDLAILFSRASGIVPFEVLPCDEASEWTTCHLTCCEADVEWFAPRLCLTSHGSPTAGPSTSTYSPNNVGTFKDIMPLQAHPIRIRAGHLEISEDLISGLYPFSGLRPSILNGSSAFTAIYLLVTEDPLHDQHQNSGALADASLEIGHPQYTNFHPTYPPAVWTTLISLVSWCSGQAKIKTKLSGSRQLSINFLNEEVNHHPVALLALVDIITGEDDTGRPISRAVVHQRLHHLPQMDMSCEQSS